MEYLEILQTTGAVSGLFCLTVLILAVKKQLKSIIL